MAAQPEQTVTSQQVQGTDAGTNAPVRPLDQTQAPSYNAQGYAVGTVLRDETGAASNLRINPETGLLYDATGLDQPPAPPSVAPGTGASDDTGTDPGNTAPTQASVATSSQNIQISPRPNILDEYPTYTWQASVYMVSPAQMDEFMKNPRRKISGYNLLFQSGGAANSSTPGQGRGSSAGTAQALNQINQADGRNPYFTDDFYIDNITVRTLAAGKGTGTAHSYTEIKFTVTEPSNITLIDRLYLAAKDLTQTKTGAKPNYASALYIMIIRFYAMDLNGKIIQVGANSSINAPNGDRYALVEKYIPFQVKSINMTIDGKMVNYDWEGTPLGAFQGLTTRRGTIPFNVELTGATVDQMLAGDAIYETAQAPAANPGAATTTSAPQPGTPEVTREDVLKVAQAPQIAPPKITASTVTQGIIAAMNQQQRRFVDEKRRKYPDVYKIAYTPEAEARIKQATVRKPSKRVSTASTSMAPAASENPQALDPNKQSVKTQERNFAIQAGTQMVQVIETIVRNSSYITDQANIVFDEQTNAERPNPQAKSKDKGFQWFSIIPTARQLDGQYDDIINDFAVEITYTIAVYEVRQINSPYFNAPRFQGVHKKYYYWFTGQNNAVLEYKETHNNLYYQTVTGAIDIAKKTFSSSMAEIPYYWPSARSAESGQGAEGRANDLAANAAENLYNLADLANAKLRIIGDPAWMMQGSIIGISDASQLTPQPFNTDGSINFDTQDVLFEIAWQKPEDYSLATGLADPYSKFATNGAQQPLQSRVYKATSVLSEFRGGYFEQTIEGTIYMYPIPKGTNTAPDNPRPSTSLATAEVGTGANDTATPDDEGQDPRSDTTEATQERTNAVTPGQNLALPRDLALTGASAALTGQPLPSFGTGLSLLNASFMQPTAGTSLGLRLPATIDFTSVATNDRTSTPFPVTPADQAQSVPPPGATTSNGVVVGLANVRLDLQQIQLVDPQVMSRDA